MYSYKLFYNKLECNLLVEELNFSFYCDNYINNKHYSIVNPENPIAKLNILKLIQIEKSDLDIKKK